MRIPRGSVPTHANAYRRREQSARSRRSGHMHANRRVLAWLKEHSSSYFMVAHRALVWLGFAEVALLSALLAIVLIPAMIIVYVIALILPPEE